ncbi:hypothetical protein MAR_032092 [Mya arenaria]|uniref:Palmitoyltransferase n=1 Tax=Mya arenaria TaxID=6604 RepID=A0ABY7F9Y3_MYAAR|nr:hypothetical protein MAR_032092 [Mya arenaria]
MDSIKETLNNVRKRLVRCANPRANTDAMSEVLDIIGAPIYLYVITYVCYFGYHYLDDYHYGEIDENGERRWIWYFQKGLIVCIYFQMMANWFEIRFVDSSLANAAKNMTLDQQTLDKIKLPDKTEAEITEKGDCKTQNESGAVKRRKGGKTDKNNGSALVQVKKISYWSWKPCDKCQLNAPPRCHHCPFCNSSINSCQRDGPNLSKRKWTNENFIYTTPDLCQRRSKRYLGNAPWSQFCAPLRVFGIRLVRTPFSGLIIKSLIIK